ncbi:MAG: hypothetical protein EON59_15050 [Alphaproteobacteria bacterium]|nr:MAG: hypothetical protein EON59_15050 [Alphaproteobacteria bacterium]
MEAKHLVILCGLPGAGKTTLAKRLQEREGFYYADVGADKRFAEKVPMWQIASDLYKSHGAGRHMVTEGVLITRARRDGFSDRIWKAVGNRNPLMVREPRLFLIQEDLATLNGRRPSRSVAAYQELSDTMELGSDKFPIQVIDASIETIDDRVDFILASLSQDAHG